TPAPPPAPRGTAFPPPTRGFAEAAVAPGADSFHYPWDRGSARLRMRLRRFSNRRTFHTPVPAACVGGSESAAYQRLSRVDQLRRQDHHSVEQFPGSGPPQTFSDRAAAPFRTPVAPLSHVLAPCTHSPAENGHTQNRPFRREISAEEQSPLRIFA